MSAPVKPYTFSDSPPNTNVITAAQHNANFDALYAYLLANQARIEGASVMQTGVFSARPAANTVAAGTIYLATDTYDVSVSNGTVWVTTTPGNRSSFTAQQTVAQSVPTSTWTKMAAAEVSDVAGDYNASNQFTAPVKGHYAVEVIGWLTSLASGKEFTIALYKNGSALTYVQAGTTGVAGASQRPVSLSHLIKLNAGDYLEVYCWHNDGSTQNGFLTFGGHLVAQLP